MSVGIRPGCPATSGRGWCQGRKREIALESKRRGSRVAGKFSLVAGKMSRVRNNPHFFKQAFERTSHFLPNTTMLLKRKRGRKPGETCYRFGSKQPFMGRSSETISNLKCLIKHSWMVPGSVEKGHLFWKIKTKLQENRSVEPGSSKWTSPREDLCDADHISALNSKIKMHM